MTTHTAIAATTLGSIDTVQVLSTKPGAGQVLVKVAYSSMTPIDVYAIDVGLYVDSHPYRLGYSLSGTITEIGDAVPDLAVGDRVSIIDSILQSISHPIHLERSLPLVFLVKRPKRCNNIAF